MTPPARTRLLAGAVLAVVVAVGIAACSSSNAPRAASSTSNSDGSQARTGQFGAGPRGPAASGLIAAVDAADIQVQNASTGQTEVTFTSKTRFTETAAATRAALTVGSCVLAISSTSSDVTSVTISPAQNGQCTAGFGRPTDGRSFSGGVRPSGAPSGFPSDVPSNLRSGARATFGDIVSGKVTALNGNALTVASRTSTGTAPKTVTLTSSTKYELTGVATKAALKVGRCATAEGSTGTTGAVAATSIAVTPAVSGQCSFTFGRRVTGGNGNG